MSRDISKITSDGRFTLTLTPNAPDDLMLTDQQAARSYKELADLCMELHHVAMRQAIKMLEPAAGTERTDPA
jgi:hypothetical protein